MGIVYVQPKRKKNSSRVVLQTNEVAEIMDYSKRMVEFKKKNQHPNYKQDNDHTDLEVTRLGYTGEAIVYKFLNRYPEYQSIMKTITKKTFIDITVKHGKKLYDCDIKSSHQGNRMYVSKRHVQSGAEDEIDAYIFVQVAKDFKSGIIKGIVSKPKYLHHRELKKYKTECYALDTRYLTSTKQAKLK